MNKKFGFLFILILIVGILIGFGPKHDGGDDRREAIVNSNGVILRSISPLRRMVNELEIGGEVRLWIPGGLGWYESNKIEKLLKQERKTELMSAILFYNFGFITNTIKFGEINNLDGWMIRREKINGQLSQIGDKLSTIMPRDFADSQIIEEGIRLSVYNLGSANGLASFVARDLEWMGLAVISVESINRDLNVEICKIVFNKQVESSKSFNNLKKQFDMCQFESSETLSNNEVEVYLSDKYSQVLNYGSYNNN